MKNRQFWGAIFLLITITVIGVGNYFRWWDWRVPAGIITSTHWAVVIGSGYLAIFTPVFSYLKHHGRYSKNLLTIHVFGNLIAFLLITVHFTQQEARPTEFAAEHSTGLILFILVGVMVLTGLFIRFRIFTVLIKAWRFFHVGLILSFYIVLIVHILQYFNLL